ncbi:MAG: TatD family hydrolase [Chitinophagales bacterium]|nr:TatD family hydrolase [Chitinophagales bacterium]
MNYWIDSHAHIYQPNFEEDIDEVIQRALSQNVRKIILPNIDLASLDRMVELTKKYPLVCFPTVGLHPCDVKEDFEEVLKTMKNWIDIPNQFSQGKVFAIGETGLDYYWDVTFKEEQKNALKIQIEWAKELNLPIILHTRESVQDTIDLIKENWTEQLRGVFHCFSGTRDEAEQILEIDNFYLGIGGPLTYKKSDSPAIFSNIPLERILLETDAPYLPPTPYRGKRNESSYIPIIAQKLAEVKNCSIEEIQISTTQNAVNLFGV